jgi:hypothetical protein
MNEDLKASIPGRGYLTGQMATEKVFLTSTNPMFQKYYGMLADSG